LDGERVFHGGGPFQKVQGRAIFSLYGLKGVGGVRQAYGVLVPQEISNGTVLVPHVPRHFLYEFFNRVDVIWPSSSGVAIQVSETIKTAAAATSIYTHLKGHRHGRPDTPNFEWLLIEIKTTARLDHDYILLIFSPKKRLVRVLNPAAVFPETLFPLNILSHEIAVFPFIRLGRASEIKRPRAVTRPGARQNQHNNKSSKS
jgi:hypothetical protein